MGQTILTEEEVDKIEEYLESIDCQPKRGSHYFSCKCPIHDDRAPSAQCYYDDGFVHCYVCGYREHINWVAKQRGDPPVLTNKYTPRKEKFVPSEERGKTEHRPKELPLGDFTPMWLDLEPLPERFSLKGVPAVELNKRGWRAFPQGDKAFGAIFIPYFDMTRSKVHYYQIRYLEGDVRFTVSPGVKQIAYGLEQLPKCEKYLCFTEGSRDSVILGMVGVPAVAMINSTANATLAGMMKYARDHNLRPVAICDNDEAGEHLLSELPCGVIDYRLPKKMGKDVGDLLESRGLEAVRHMFKQFIVPN